MNKDLEEFNRFISEYGVSLELATVEANPLLAADGRKEHLAHYRCKLTNCGRQLEVHVSVGAEDAAPTLFDVLFMLALDATGCDMMAGFQKYREKWAGMFGASGRRPGEIELFWEELESRCEQSRKVRDFLGAAPFEELLDLFGLGKDGNSNEDQ